MKATEGAAVAVNHVIAVPIKESKSEKCDTNHESEDKTAKINIDTQIAARDKVTAEKIKSNQTNLHLIPFPGDTNKICEVGI